MGGFPEANKVLFPEFPDRVMPDDGADARGPADLEHAAAAVDLISKKWHPVIVQLLLSEESLGFSDLKRRMDGISGKVLSTSLDDLEEKDLVNRRVVNESPLRVEYTLTERGADMKEAIQALADWGETHLGGKGKPKILIVDDDRRIAEMHAGWLEDAFETETAYNGKEALRNLDSDTDVALLDRRMPGLSGDEVVEQIRAHNFDCFVIMVTSSDPDFDVIDMPLDDYIVKPSTRQEIVDTIESVLERENADKQRKELLSLRAKKAILTAEKTDEELASSEEFGRLVDRLEELSEKLGESPAGADEAAVGELL